MIERVGLIGVGKLGLAIAERLMAAGFAVTGYRRGSLDGLIAAGGTAAASIREAAQRSDVVLTCLPSAAALADVIGRDDGLLAGARPGLTLIETSTVPVADKKRHAGALEAAGMTLLDCPISGTPEMMRAGRAAVFAGGDRSAFDEIRPVLDAIAPRVTHVGGVGAGSILKYIANMLAGMHNLAAAEAMTLGARAGIDPAAIHDAITGSPASSAIFEARGAMMARRRYDVGSGKLAGFYESFAAAVAFAGEVGGAFPLLTAADETFRRAIAEGYADRKQAELFEYLLEREA